MKRAPSTRFGFTLIEFFVSIAVIGILVSLATPAVQSAREAARRTHCSDNLREMGIALANFHSAYGRFPPGRDAKHNHQHSWCTAILPYLEQPAIFDRYDYKQKWDSPANESAARTTLGIFNCPSAPSPDPGETDYGGNYGSSLSGLTPGFARGAAWSAGTLLTVGLTGHAYRPVGVRVGEITDGTSQTLLVVEAAYMPPSLSGRWANGNNCVAHDNGPINSGDCSNEIGSYHTGGAQVLFSDGHVEFLTESINLELLGALATRAHRESTAR